MSRLKKVIQVAGTRSATATTDMIKLRGCPRCHGAVLEYPGSDSDRTMCVNCGWQRADVSAEIQAQVTAHLGKPYMEDRYAHHRIATGKPPLSGWDRVKRRREREMAIQADRRRAAGGAS